MFLNNDNSRAWIILIQNLVVFFRVLCARGDFTSIKMNGCYLMFIIIYYYYFELL